MVAVSVVISGISITTVMSTYYLFKQILDTTHVISNPHKLIYKVLDYARRHKYPENRSALTYYLNEAPSRIDLGKHKYGGPFEEEQVEDVKTVLRYVPLLSCLFGITSAIHIGNLDNESEIFYLGILTVVLSFNMVIRPCCGKYVPRMLVRITVGLIICLLSVLVALTADIVVSTSLRGTGNYSCFFDPDLSVHHTWMLVHVLSMISKIISAVGFAVGVSVSFELTIAQSPGHMRGLMIGIWFCVLGIAAFCSFLLYIPFHYIDSSSLPLNCTFFYHATTLLLLLLVLLVFTILAKYYKLRVREEVVNIHEIVASVYDRYMEQADEIDHFY